MMYLEFLLVYFIRLLFRSIYVVVKDMGILFFYLDIYFWVNSL